MHQLVIEIWRRHSIADPARHPRRRRGTGPGRPGRPDGRGLGSPTAGRSPCPRSDRAPSQPEIAGPRAEILRALGVKPDPAQPQATEPRTKEQHEHLSEAPPPPSPRRRRGRPRRRPRAVLALAGCGGSATGNEGAVNDDGSVDLDEGHPDRRRPEGRLQGAAPGRRRARRRALRDRVEGVHLRSPAARGAERRLDPRRRRRQHPAAVRGRRQERVQGRSRPRRTAARATRSWSRRAPTSSPSRTSRARRSASPRAARPTTTCSPSSTRPA